MKHNRKHNQGSSPSLTEGKASYAYDYKGYHDHQVAWRVTVGQGGREIEKHVCAPPEWREIENITGDYDFDASIAMCRNPDMQNRLVLYLSDSSGSYGGRTGYSGYDRYSSDD